MKTNNLIHFAKELRKRLASAFLSYPKKVECNVCGWKGRRFLSDPWHKFINCPNCYSGVRQRLFYAALRNMDSFSFANILDNKRILHFAPEDIIRSDLRQRCAHYLTTDYLRDDCDLKLDMTSMPDIGSEGFDIVIAFDVLEHVPDYRKALEEVHRILSKDGLAIFTVPQKDNLSATYENPDILTPDDRLKHFGQFDHLRIFGSDFAKTVEGKGFSVTAVDESYFPEEMIEGNVLAPPQLSKHPLATNHRRVFFCQKI